MKKFTLIAAFLFASILLAGCGKQVDTASIENNLAECSLQLDQQIALNLSGLQTIEELSGKLAEKSIYVPQDIQDEIAKGVDKSTTPVAPKTTKTTKTGYSYSNVEADYNWVLPDNASRAVFRTLTGTAFMNELNATVVKAPTDATSAELSILLDVSGPSASSHWKNTYNVIIGYVNCKINYDIKELPYSAHVDLTNMPCFAKSKSGYNALADLKAGKKVAIYFARDNWVTSNGTINFK